MYPYYYYAHTVPWCMYAPPVHQQHEFGAGPKIVELEPSELGARSQLSELNGGYRSHYDVLSLPHPNVSKRSTDSQKRYSTITGVNRVDYENERIFTRRLGTKQYLLEDGATMNNGRNNQNQNRPRSWKEVNDDISARMMAASSDSPPIIPKRDYDHSPAPSLPRPNRSVSSNGANNRFQNEDARANTMDVSEWQQSQMEEHLENGYNGPPHPPTGQMVLYTGGGPPPLPPPPPPFPMQDCAMFPPPLAMMPFGPPPDLYGFHGMPPPPFGHAPPVFMEPQAESIYGPPPITFLPPPPPGHPAGPMAPMFPMDFEMFMWNQQKNKKGKKPPKRSRSMEFVLPPPPPGPWMMPPPPPFMEENAYGIFQQPPPMPPPRPPLPMALPPLPLPSGPPITNQSNSSKKQSLNHESKNEKKEEKTKEQKQSTCYLMCCKGFTQILWIIIGIILIGLVLGLVLGLTLV